MEDKIIKLRESLDEINFFENKDIIKFPEFYEFVDCKYIDNKNFQMFLGGHDDLVAARFYWNGCYERKTLDLWSMFCKNINQGFIIDIGAHTGSYTLTSMSTNKSNITFSFEPHFINYSRMNLNLRKNNFTTRNVFMVCVGNNKKIVPFSINGNFDFMTSGGSVGERNTSISITQNLPQISLDEFVKKEDYQKIALIKIDVEGYELNAFLGMTGILNLAKPTIFFEALPDANKNEISKLLNSFGYVYYDIDDKNYTVKLNTTLENGSDYFNHNKIAIHKDSVHKQLIEIT